MFRSLVVFAGLANMIAVPVNILTVVYARTVLHGSSKIYGLLEVSMLCRAILGSFAAGRYSSRLRLWQWLGIALIGSGGALVGLGLLVNGLTAMGFLVVFPES
jgi:hypothetical protein